jgi:thymidylate kinase
MPEILPSYQQVVDALAPVMRGLPGIIVTIDGRDGAGKTTLGRYLAWHFNVTLIETDLFLIPTQDHLIYLDDQINRIIERRVTWPLPVIVEGVAMLQLMKRISRVPAFTLYLTNRQHPVSTSVKRRLASYEATFNPSANADLMVTIER